MGSLDSVFKNQFLNEILNLVNEDKVSSLNSLIKICENIIAGHNFVKVDNLHEVALQIRSQIEDLQRGESKGTLPIPLWIGEAKKRLVHHVCYAQGTLASLPVEALESPMESCLEVSPVASEVRHPEPSVFKIFGVSVFAIIVIGSGFLLKSPIAVMAIWSLILFSGAAWIIDQAFRLKKLRGTTYA